MNLVDDIPISDDGFHHVNCIIEIPKGTNTKYEYDEDLNIFKLDRCLVSSLQYPINYGFIPQTLALDNDPLDVLVFNHDPIDRASLVSCRVLGVLGFIDGGEVDNKIIAVPNWSPVEKYKTVHDIESCHLKIYRQFFRIYKIDRDSDTKVGEWKSKGVAMQIVKDSHERWKKANAERFHQEWADKRFWQRIRDKSYILHPD
ncbi:MAG TPA: inorganic diphosphatase [Flavobacteriaceae bacterium]|nr:inorganic diphosphatase [Flavobacteriaceae bacterium]